MRKILFKGFIVVLLVVFVTQMTQYNLTIAEKKKISLDEFREKNIEIQCKDKIYNDITVNIMNRVKYFPVAECSNQNMKVNFENTWMNERTYGGKRGHEGTDLIASVNKRNIYPIVSMTDGTVTQKGWLEKGGYRIGITTEEGVYFYYAHLASYASVEVGDHIKAGDLLGFMGDSGYGPEGTVGQFAVHLHLGIYVEINGEEFSLNPYWLLRYIENKTVKWYTEI